MFWQTTTVALAGIVIGVPADTVVGRLIWQAFPANLGVVPVPVVSAAGRRACPPGEPAPAE